MRLTDFAIIFMCIVFTFNIGQTTKIKDLNAVQNKRLELNRALENATDDATRKLVEVGGEYKKLKINKEEAVRQFYKTLYLNLNLMDDKLQQTSLEQYIPAIAIIDYDGYYIYSNEEYIENGEPITTKVWQPKKYFTHKAEDNKYIYMFTISDYVTVYSTGEEKIYEGKRADVAKEIDTFVLRDEEEFDQTRRETIVRTIQEDLIYYFNKCNEIGRHFGQTYNFYLPQIEEHDWTNTIDDIGMFVFFQGFPMGVTNEKYNYYVLGGARVYKKTPCYIEVVDDIGYYHRENCGHLTEDKQLVSSKEEAASRGYRPCPDCRP